MPIYEFHCRACGLTFEALTPVGGEKNVVCSGCKSKDIHKLVSAFGIGGTNRRLQSSSCSTCSATSCDGCQTN